MRGVGGVIAAPREISTLTLFRRRWRDIFTRDVATAWVGSPVRLPHLAAALSSQAAAADAGFLDPLMRVRRAASRSAWRCVSASRFDHCSLSSKR